MKLNNMKIDDFKLTKNRLDPEMCYEYRFDDANIKYQIFTMDYGRSFNAMIEKRDKTGCYILIFSKKVGMITTALNEFCNFMKKI